MSGFNQNNSLIWEWEDTKKYFNQNRKKIPLSTKYDIYNLSEPDDINNPSDNKPVIEILDQDTFTMAINYLDEGLNPLVINMASDFKPGGGVSSGKTAQEEELFRRSNAHLTHPRNWYPLDIKDVIYSPEVTIVKDSRDKGYKLIEPKIVSMIAVAAIRNPKLKADYTYKNFHYNLMLNKIESIFKIGVKHKHDSLVLGALGCGAFHNPPEEVAKIFKIMVDKYGKYFKKIGFAILVVKGNDMSNIKAFEKYCVTT